MTEESFSVRTAREAGARKRSQKRKTKKTKKTKKNRKNKRKGRKGSQRRGLKQRRPKTRGKGKRKSGNKSSKRRNGGKRGNGGKRQGNGGKRTSRRKGRNGTETEEEMDCLTPAVKYLNQIAGVVSNFERQRKRAERHFRLLAKKNNRTDSFTTVAGILLEAGGGNVSKLSCAGQTNSTAAATLTNLTTTLTNCNRTVNESCGPDSVAPLNQTLVDICVDLTGEFSEAVDKCSDISDLSEACQCWNDPSLAEASSLLRDCDIKDAQTNITAQKDVCVGVFAGCRAAEDQSVSAVAACPPPTTAAPTTAAPTTAAPTAGELLEQVGWISPRTQY